MVICLPWAKPRLYWRAFGARPPKLSVLEENQVLSEKMHQLGHSGRWQCHEMSCGCTCFWLCVITEALHAHTHNTCNNSLHKQIRTDTNPTTWHHLKNTAQFPTKLIKCETGMEYHCVGGSKGIAMCLVHLLQSICEAGIWEASLLLPQFCEEWFSTAYFID